MMHNGGRGSKQCPVCYVLFGGLCILLMASLLHDTWKNSKRGGGRGQIKSEADFMTVPQRLS